MYKASGVGREVPPWTGRVQRMVAALGCALGYTCRGGGGESPARAGGTQWLADERLRAEGSPAGQAQERFPAAVTAWAAFSAGAAQADPAATRARGAPVSARDVGRVSQVGSAAVLLSSKGLGRRRGDREEQTSRCGVGGGGAGDCPAQSLRVRAQAHSMEQRRPRSF